MLVPGLYQFFHRQVQDGFGTQGVGEPAAVDYVSDLLTRFTQIRTFHAIRNASGEPVTSIAGLLAERRRTQGWDNARVDRPREALIVRHIGEYSLFMSGLFRDRLTARGQLGYYLDQGRSAFWHCASFESDPARIRLFRYLYGTFDRVSAALDHMRRIQLPLTPANAPVSPLAALWRARQPAAPPCIPPRALW
ncbi:MAG: hypothetical protein M0039_01180 [Pseudomonadota bacterium]|nr:hypothetical protein [Pseudomonadota bacterium]